MRRFARIGLVGLVYLVAVTVHGLSGEARAPVDDGPFAGCGMLVQGVECVLFQADAGGLYVLQDYGGYGVGDYVFVEGWYDPTCPTFCMQGDGCIVDNTIGPCGPFEVGDLNCDGVLNAFDIDPFVLALTAPSQYVILYPECDLMLADINGDGFVDAFDIDPFVELLTGG